MGDKEELVRQRRARERNEKMHAHQAREEELEKERKQWVLQLKHRITKIRKESERVALLFERADWEYAELRTWRIQEVTHTRLLKRKRVRISQVTLATLTIVSWHNGDTILLRSDGVLYFEPLRRGVTERLIFHVGATKDMDSYTIGEASIYVQEADRILRALKACVKPRPISIR